MQRPCHGAAGDAAEEHGGADFDKRTCGITDLSALRAELAALETESRRHRAKHLRGAADPFVAEQVVSFLPVWALGKALRLSLVWARAAAARGALDAPWPSRRDGAGADEVRVRIERLAAAADGRWRAGLQGLRVERVAERCVPAPLPGGVWAGHHATPDAEFWTHTRCDASGWSAPPAEELALGGQRPEWARLLDLTHSGLRAPLCCVTLRFAGGVVSRFQYDGSELTIIWDRSPAPCPASGGEEPGRGTRQLVFRTPQVGCRRVDNEPLDRLVAARWCRGIVEAMGFPPEDGAFHRLFADSLGVGGIPFDWPDATLAEFYADGFVTQAAVRRLLPELVQLTPPLQAARVFMHAVERSADALLELCWLRDWEAAVAAALREIHRLRSEDDFIEQWAEAAHLSVWRRFPDEFAHCKAIADRMRDEELITWNAAGSIPACLINTSPYDRDPGGSDNEEQSGAPAAEP